MQVPGAGPTPPPESVWIPAPGKHPGRHLLQISRAKHVKGGLIRSGGDDVKEDAL